jgi:hypothetical protein
MDKDWSEYHVQLEPLTRQLHEQLNRDAYNEANRTVNKIMDVILTLKSICLHKRV